MPIQIGELRARLIAENQSMKQEIRNTKKDFVDLGTQAKKTAADMQSLNDALTKAGLSADQIKKLAGSMDSVEKGSKSASQAAKELGDHAGHASKSVSDLDESVKQVGSGKQGIEETKKSVEGLHQHSHTALGSFMDLNMALQDVGANSKQVEAINAALRRTHPEIVQQQLATVRTELEKLGVSSNEIDDIVENMERLSKSTSRTSAEVDALGAAYATLSIAIAAAIAKAVQTASEFQQSMQNVKAITEATGEEFAALRQEAIKLGAQTKYSASQAADAMAELGQAGFDTKEIIAAMPGVLSLAAAGNVDLATTADIASSILRGFSLEATETGRVVDVLAKSSIDTNANITDLGEAMKYVAPVAASMGLSIEEATAAVGELSNAGIKGEQAGTSLRAILLALASPSKEAAFYMDRLGVSIKDSAGNIVPLSNLISQLTSVWGRLTQAQQADVAATLVGREAASGFIALIEAGQGQLVQYTESLQNAGGTAERVAGEQMDTLKGSVDNMTSALESAGITVGDTFLPAVRKAVEGVTSLLTGFTDLDPATQRSIVAFTTATPLVLGSVTAFYTLKKAVDAARISMAAMGMSVPVVGQIALVIGAVASGAAYLSGKYAEAKEQAKGFEEAQKALNDALNQSPLSRTTEEVQKLRDESAELTKTLQERTRLQEHLAELDEKIKSTPIDQPLDRDILTDAKETKEALEEIEDGLNGVYGGADKAREKLNLMNKAINDSVPALLQEQSATFQAAAANNEHLKGLENALKTYQSLSKLQSLDVVQKQELNAATQTLTNAYPSLHAALDKEGNLRITNIGLAEDQITSERGMLDATLSYERQRIDSLQRTTEAQKKAVEAQISNYEALMQTLLEVINAQGMAAMNSPASLQAEQLYIHNQPRGAQLYANQNAVQSALNDISARRAKLESGDISGLAGYSSGPGIDLGEPAKAKSTKSRSSSGKTPAELAAEARKQAYENDLKTVQFQSEYYDLSADKQIQKYEALRKKHAQFLKESVDDARTLTLQIKRLNEDSVKDRYDFSATWIDAEEKRMEDSGKTEKQIAEMKLASWTRLRDRYKKDSEQYKAADEQVRQSRKDLTTAQEEEARNQYEASEKWITAEERRMSDAGKSETEIAQMKIDAWTRVRDRYKKDSELFQQADEELYNAQKELAEKLVDLADDFVDKEKDAIEQAKQADLDAIDVRKEAYIAAQDAKIKAIEDLIAAEEEYNSDADYETQLAEKNARIKELASAVGPEGIAEREQAIKDRDRMILEHERELRKRELESQKDALEDEKDAQTAAFDAEKDATEAQYNALKEAFDSYAGDIKTIEAAISSFRVSSAANANSEILAGLDDFLSQYSAKMSAVIAAQAEAQEALDLAEYNANKDAWAMAKAAGNKAEMARLEARNAEIRAKYGITEDTGKLQHFSEGGIVQGPSGAAVPIIAHADEIVINPEQQRALFRLLNAPQPVGAAAVSSKTETTVTNHFDMSVNGVILEDRADTEIFFSEREKTARRLQTMGVK